jgi:hypothetical protein
VKRGSILGQFGGRLVFDRDDHDFVAFTSRRFESEQRKAAIAGDESVTHEDLFDEAAIGRAKESQQFLHLGGLRNLFFDASQSLRGVQAGIR